MLVYCIIAYIYYSKANDLANRCFL